MEFTSPRVYRLAATTLDVSGVDKFLSDYNIDSPEWRTDRDDEPHQNSWKYDPDAQVLTEIAGRLCYKSFRVGLNANVTRIRSDSKAYLANLLDSGHGSVLEHSTVTFALLGVSRVFTHELVRHRPGVAFSQESLRYVRLDNLEAWFPASLEPDALLEMNVAETKDDANHVYGQLKDLFRKLFDSAEITQKKLAKLLDLDKLDFEVKKKLTSAFRRLAPMGLSTNIIITANHRMWRHMIEQRTSRHAEEEIRAVFGMIYLDLYKNDPSLYQDAQTEEVNNMLEVKFKNSKI